MAEFRAQYTLAIDVEIYFEAADDDTADWLAEKIGEAAVLAIGDPTPAQIAQIDESLRGIVLDVSYDGPNGSELNDGPWTDDEDY